MTKEDQQARIEAQADSIREAREEMARREPTYQVNEVFYSVQGEGYLAGTPMIFVRFSKCNMKCEQRPGEKSPGGFDCDTEFESGRMVTLPELADWVESTWRGCSEIRPGWMLLTGGEPALQLNQAFLEYFALPGRDLGPSYPPVDRPLWKIAIETNGSKRLPSSNKDPDTWEAWERQLDRREIGPHQTNWEDLLWAVHPLLHHITVSPKVAEHAIRQRMAHEVRYVRGAGQSIPRTRVHATHRYLSPAFGGLNPDMGAIQTCVDLALENPAWRVSVQGHKLWGVR